jgi:cyanophycin synthetase
MMRQDAQQRQILNRAKQMDISVLDASGYLRKHASILEKGSASELIVKGVPTSWINARGQVYCDNKQLMKLAFMKLDIPFPKSMIFSIPDKAMMEGFFEKGKSYVCKPLDEAQGAAVVLGITNMDMLRNYYAEYAREGRRFMIEEQVPGEHLRLQVIGGKIVAACIRQPAYVVGDGRTSLSQLVEQRRRVMARQNPDNWLEIDSQSRKLIKEQGLSLSAKPLPGQKVKLKYISNMATGGIAVDVTEEIHPGFQDWVTALADYLEMPYFGFDMLTTDYTVPPEEATKALEVNAFADWLHHTFSERKTHDIASMILEELFGGQG